MDPVKVEGIRNWPTPTTVKEVRSFLGFGNFYKGFISHYSEMAHPLYDLTKKNQQWHWEQEHDAAFTRLKDAFISYPVLRCHRPFLSTSRITWHIIPRPT
jgi:hypothetical protein